jgi:hypothetical protein
MQKNKMSSESKLKLMVPQEESILCDVAPVTKPFYIERIVEELAIPLVWMLITFYILNIYLGFEIPIIPIDTLIAIMVIANIPIIIWLSRTLMSGIALKNTYYIVTDKAIYFKNGANEFEVFSTREERYEYKDIIRVWNHYGIVDRMFNVGDVYVELVRNGKIKTFYIIDVKGPDMVLDIIERAQKKAMQDAITKIKEEKKEADINVQEP